MSVVSAGKTGPGRIVPGRQGGPHRQRRFDTPFIIGAALGVLINLALLLALYFRTEPEAAKPQPQAIPVELVKQPPAPKPQQQAKQPQQAKPQPKPEPKKTSQPKIDTKYMRSGGESQDKPQGAPKTGSPDIKEKQEKAQKEPKPAEKEKPVEKAEEKKDRGALEKHVDPIGPLPAWARHVTQGYGGTMKAAPSTHGAEASGPEGGGNRYLNKMRDKISKRITAMRIPLPERAARFLITVARDGQVTDVQLQESSGLDAFDQGAYAAIIRASPFDPLPAYIDGDYVDITFTFRPEAASPR